MRTSCNYGFCRKKAYNGLCCMTIVMDFAGGQPMICSAGEKQLIVDSVGGQLMIGFVEGQLKTGSKGG